MSSEELPKGWVSAAIGQLVGHEGVFVDGDWVESKDQDPEGDVRLIQLADVGDGEFRDRSSRFLTTAKAHELGCTFLEKGDMLIARMPDPLGRCCIFPLDGKAANVTVVDVCIVRVGSSPIDGKYLMYAINSADIRNKISDLQSGSTRKRISRGNLATIKLPVAPLSEQRRIVAKIEELFSELDKGVESITTAREQLKAYRQSVLKAAFEGALTEGWRRLQQNLPAASAIVAGALTEKGRTGRGLSKDDAVVPPTVPSEWGTIALGDLGVDVFDGPFGSNLKTSDYVDSGVRVIRLENIGHGKFIEEKRSYVSMEKYEDLKRHTVVPGDIVVSSFVTDAIRSTMVPASVTVSINKADCFAVRFRGDAMISEFAQRFLESRCAYKQMEGMIHGVGRPRINTTQLKQLILPICSRAEQIELLSAISSAYSEIDALDAELTAQLEKANALRQSILKRAFSGQLVAQDPADEPACVLLERIRAERDGGGATKRRNNKNSKKEAA